VLPDLVAPFDVNEAKDWPRNFKNIAQGHRRGYVDVIHSDENALLVGIRQDEHPRSNRKQTSRRQATARTTCLLQFHVLHAETGHHRASIRHVFVLAWTKLIAHKHVAVQRRRLLQNRDQHFELSRLESTLDDTIVVRRESRVSVDDRPWKRADPLSYVSSSTMNLDCCARLRSRCPMPMRVRTTTTPRHSLRDIEVPRRNIDDERRRARVKRGDTHHASTVVKVAVDVRCWIVQLSCKDRREMARVSARHVCRVLTARLYALNACFKFFG
jgi:hypothetical protein